MIAFSNLRIKNPDPDKAVNFLQAAQASLDNFASAFENLSLNQCIAHGLSAGIKAERAKASLAQVNAELSKAFSTATKTLADFPEVSSDLDTRTALLKCITDAYQVYCIEVEESNDQITPIYDTRDYAGLQKKFPQKLAAVKSAKNKGEAFLAGFVLGEYLQSISMHSEYEGPLDIRDANKAITAISVGNDLAALDSMTKEIFQEAK